MKNTFKSFWSDLEKFQKQDNPWAICHAQGLTGDKFERCVMHVKEKLGVHKTSDIEKSKGDTVGNHFGHKVREKDVFDWLQTRITGYREGGSTATRLIDDVVQHFAINHSDAVDLVHDFIEDAIPPEERGFFKSKKAARDLKVGDVTPLGEIKARRKSEFPGLIEFDFGDGSTMGLPPEEKIEVVDRKEKSLIPAAIGASIAAITAKLQSMLNEPPFPAFEVTYELTDQLGKVSCQTFMVKEDSKASALAKVKEMTDQMADFARTHEIKDVRVSDMREKSMEKTVPNDEDEDMITQDDIETVLSNPERAYHRGFGIDKIRQILEDHSGMSSGKIQQVIDSFYKTRKAFKSLWTQKIGVDGTDPQSRLMPLPKGVNTSDNYTRRGQEEKSMEKAVRLDHKFKYKGHDVEVYFDDKTYSGYALVDGDEIDLESWFDDKDLKRWIDQNMGKSQDDMDKMGVEGAGPVPNSLLAEQDLEGKKKKPAEKSIVQLEDLADKAVDVDSLKEKHDLVGRIKARQLKDQKQTVDERKIKRITLEI